MALNCPFTFGPIFLSSTYTTDILSPGTLTGGTVPVAATKSTWAASGYSMRIVLYHIRITNNDATSPSFRLYVGLSATNTAGTEFMGYNVVVATASYVDWNGRLVLDATTNGGYLVGGASSATKLIIQGEGEIGIK